MDETTLKKEIYRNLALSIFGNLIGYGTDNKIVIKHMYFVNDPAGDLFLFSRKTAETENLNMNQPVFFSVFKEEEIASEFVNIKIEGKLALVDRDSQDWEQGMDYFADKSPFIGNIPWVDNPENYDLFFLRNEKITFQKTRDERIGKAPIYLIREQEGN